MIKLELTQFELPVLVTIIEAPAAGLFVSKLKRYLKNVINSATAPSAPPVYVIEIDNWIALWLLSTMYNSEVEGASASFMFKLEDALSEVSIEVNA